jgi:hypothetical protein
LINKKFSSFTATNLLFSEQLSFLNNRYAVLLFGCKFTTKNNTGKKKLNIFVFLRVSRPQRSPSAEPQIMGFRGHFPPAMP